MAAKQVMHTCDRFDGAYHNFFFGGRSTTFSLAWYIFHGYRIVFIKDDAFSQRVSVVFEMPEPELEHSRRSAEAPHDGNP